MAGAKGIPLLANVFCRGVRRVWDRASRLLKRNFKRAFENGLCCAGVQTQNTFCGTPMLSRLAFPSKLLPTRAQSRFTLNTSISNAVFDSAPPLLTNQ